VVKGEGGKIRGKGKSITRPSKKGIERTLRREGSTKRGKEGGKGGGHGNGTRAPVGKSKI